MIIRREKYYFINVDSLPSNEVEGYVDAVKKNIASENDKAIKLINFFIPVRNQPTKITLVEYTEDNTQIAYIV